MKKQALAVIWVARAFMTICLLCGLTAQAQSGGCATQEACLAHIEQLRADRSANPMSALQSVNALMASGLNEDWQKAYVYAATYQLELYVKQEDINSAHTLYRQILPLAKAIDDPIITTRLMMANLKITFAHGEIESISELYVPLRKRAQESENPSEIGEIYLAIGLSEQGSFRLAEAIRSYKLAYEHFDRIKDSVSKALVLNSLADAYNNLGDKDRAVEYFSLALDLHRRVDDKFGESVVLYNLGRTYLDKEEAPRAAESFSKALKISLDIGDTIGVAWAQSALAKVALKNERWDEALTSLQEAEPVFRDAGDKQSLFENILFQASAYLGAGEVERAEQKLAQSKALLSPARTSTSYFQLIDADSRIGRAKGDYERAYAALEKKFEWIKEHTERDKQKQAQRYKTQFDTQLKEKQNQVLVQENQLKQLKILDQQRKQGVWLLVIVLAVVLLLFVATLLYFQTKNRNRFKAMAMRDHLTDCPNRRAILQFSHDRLADAARTETSLVLAIVDLDSFKQLNDRFGHDAGDEVLKNFALACSTALRQQDGFGRYGGEEWLIVLPNTTVSQVALIFDRLRTHLNALPAKGIPDDHEITFSMGVAQYDTSKHKNIDTLIKRADEKLYEAKENGRNRLAA